MKKHILLVLIPLLLTTSCAEKTSETEESSSSVTVSENSNENDMPHDDTTITIAVYGGLQGCYEKYVSRFNDDDNGYKIQIKDYREYIDETAEDPSEGYDLADMSLNTDIIKGGIVDVVCNISFFNSGYYDIMQNKGAFVDLNTFMENDPKFNVADYNEHILSLYEIDGKLCKMPVFYSVGTMVGTKKYVGDKENWTAQELIDHYNSINETTTFNMTNDKLHVFNTLIRGNLGSFIDYKNGTVSFDSPDFINMLDFCGNFGNGSGIANDVDYTSPLFVKEAQFYSFENFHKTLLEFHQKGEECTLVGYPSDDGNGSFIDDMNGAFSICQASSDSVKQGAWEFIKLIISEETQNEILSEIDEIGFPINNNSYRKLAENSMGTGENLVSMNGVMTDIGYLSEAEYNQISDYIRNTNRVNTTAYKDLNSIILEEVDNFFAGEQSAEETARLIQNKASIMVSEQAE